MKTLNDLECVAKREAEGKVKVYKEQKKENRVYLNEGNHKSYFEFGDMRLEFKKSRIIIEVDTAGGVTNLVKYFFMLESPKEFDFGKIEQEKDTRLLHIFVCKSENDYLAHRKLWEYLYNNMKLKLKDMHFEAEIILWNEKKGQDPEVESRFCELVEEAMIKEHERSG